MKYFEENDFEVEVEYTKKFDEDGEEKYEKKFEARGEVFGIYNEYLEIKFEIIISKKSRKQRVRVNEEIEKLDFGEFNIDFRGFLMPEFENRLPYTGPRIFLNFFNLIKERFKKESEYDKIKKSTYFHYEKIQKILEEENYKEDEVSKI